MVVLRVGKMAVAEEASRGGVKAVEMAAVEVEVVTGVAPVGVVKVEHMVVEEKSAM